MLPGAALGMGWGIVSRHRSVVDGVICGLLGLTLGIFADWWVLPFIKDHSFSYFVTHLSELPGAQWAFIALGAAAAAWFGMGRESRTRREE